MTLNIKPSLLDLQYTVNHENCEKIIGHGYYINKLISSSFNYLDEPQYYEDEKMA